MDRHNAIIFHCLKCGRIAHWELTATPPTCCGSAMVNAANVTTRESGLPDAKAGDEGTSRPAVV